MSEDNHGEYAAAGDTSDGARARANTEDAISAALDQGERRRALQLCARAYGDSIGRLCMAMLGSQADAEDVTQEVFIDAHRGLDGLNQPGSLRSWLLTIARRKSARRLEQRYRRTAQLRLVSSDQEPPAGLPHVASASAEARILLQQQAAKAREALAQLRPSEREALLLRFAADLSFEEMAHVCGIEPAAARKRVSRAMASLRERVRASSGSL